MARRPWWARGTRFWVAWSLCWAVWGTVALVFLSPTWWLMAMNCFSAAVGLSVAAWRVLFLNPHLSRLFDEEEGK
jgi:predicted exporter